MSTNVKKSSRLGIVNNNVFQKIERPWKKYEAMWIPFPVICTTQKYDRSYKCNCDVRKKRLFHNLTPGSWQKRFSLTSRELYRIIFCLKALLIFLCVYLLTKITLRDICHELSKQPSDCLLWTDLHSWTVRTNSTHSKTLIMCSFSIEN